MTIDLKHVKVCISTCEGKKWENRCEEIQEMLKELTFDQIEYFKGKISKPYIFAANENAIQILSSNKVPFIYMEDDARCIKENYEDILDIPKECDILYLGGTAHSNIHFVSQDPKIKINNITGIANSRLHYKHVNDKFLRIFNMFSAHAILFLTEKGKEEYLKAINTFKNQPFDVTFSMVMPNLNVYMVKKPFFYQNDGHNDKLSKNIISEDDIVKSKDVNWQKQESLERKKISQETVLVHKTFRT